jgi:hypothetical protein
VSGARPKSKGDLRLRSPDPYDPPLIDPRYLDQVADVGTLVQGIKKALRMVENTLSFQQVGAVFQGNANGSSVPGCEGYRLRSDAYWACFVRLMGVSMGDVVGTVGMGRVVDEKLRVLGVQRLRVMDASVMPNIVSGGTGAATMAIAEKGADLILKLWAGAVVGDKKVVQQGNNNNVQQLLKQSANKLRGLDSSKMFWNAIKDTESFKVFQKERLMTGDNSKSPLRLIGAMLENAVNFQSPGESPGGDVEAIKNEPFFLTPPPPVRSSPVPSTTTTRRPKIESLFQEASPPAYVTYTLEEVQVAATNPPSNSQQELRSQASSEYEVTPTPYVLQPKPIYTYKPAIQAVDVQRQLQNSQFFLQTPKQEPPGTTKHGASFSSAVDSIISRTLPILSGRHSSSSYKAATETYFPGQNVRRETEKQQGQLSSTTPMVPVYPEKIKNLEGLIIPQKPQTPPPMLPSLSLVPKPLKAVLEPFSSIMNRPFDGFMKRIRSILGRRPMPEPPSSTATTTTTTTSRPKTTTSRLSQEELLRISVPTVAPAPLLPYRMAKYSRLVQHQPAPPPIKLSTDKPPADYDLIDTNPTIVDSPPLISPVPKLLSDITVIYQRPSPPPLPTKTSSTSSRPPLTLAKNVQDLLKAFDENESTTKKPTKVLHSPEIPVVKQSQSPIQQQSFYLEEDSKTLRAEVDKLISTKPSQQQQPIKHQVFVLVGKDASSGLRTLAPAGANRESPTSTFIKKETPSLYGGGVDVQQEGSLSSLLSSSSSSASSTNLLESSSSSGNHPTEGQTLDFRNLMWPHKDKDSNLSFRIKILNQ